MTPPVQPRQTTRVMAAVQAAHGRADTGPRYALGIPLLMFSLTVFTLCTIMRIEMTVFQQRFIGACGVAGLLILPPTEAGARLAMSLFTRFKNPQSPGQ